jgi:hypothetical protein
MAKQRATDFMMSFVQDYLGGKTNRMGFDLDFNYYLMQNYRKMEREDPDMAEAFNFCLAENGSDLCAGLSDGEHKKLIRRQFRELKAIARDGFC